MKNVDELVRKRMPAQGQPAPITYPQVALVAINPHTGPGSGAGRRPQLRRHRSSTMPSPSGPPAPSSSPSSTPRPTTPASTELRLGRQWRLYRAHQAQRRSTPPSCVNGKPYTPGQLRKGEFPAWSPPPTRSPTRSTSPPSRLRQMVGFDNVAALARAAGITDARGTPSVAIGSLRRHAHRHGRRLHRLRQQRRPSRSRGCSHRAQHQRRHRLRLLSRGQAGARSARRLSHAVADGRRDELRHRLRRCAQHGFTAPGRRQDRHQHDAWFAGYTSNLLCIVWVGNDDYTDIKIQGADAAAPIWAEFMKRAIKLPQYSDVKSFTPPEGVTIATHRQDHRSSCRCELPRRLSAPPSSTAPRRRTIAAR